MAQVAVRRGEANGTTPLGELRLWRHSADVSAEHPPVPTTKRHGGAEERPSGGEGHHRRDALMDCTQSLVGTWASMTPLNAARPRARVEVARGREDLGRKTDRNQQEERGEKREGADRSQTFSSS